MDEIKVMKVSAKGDPTQVATAILMAIQETGRVKASAVGEAVKILMKSISFVSVFNSNKLNLRFTPGMEYSTGSITSNSINTFTVIIENLDFAEYKELTKDANKDENIKLVKVLNNEAIITQTLVYYKELGYSLSSFAPVYKQGKTSYFYAIFER